MMDNISHSIEGIDTLMKFNTGKSEKEQLQDYFQ